MHKDWENFLQRDLDKKAAIDQQRRLRVLTATDGYIIEINGKKLINFGSNDYLGLSHDLRLVEAGAELARDWGAGAGASRLIAGSNAPLARLEEKLAAWTGKEQALFFNSGFNANTGLLAALADRETVICCDYLNHASIYDGIRLSRGILARYRHRDLDSLRGLLARHSRAARKIIITDAVFSMEGDLAPLAKLAEIAAASGALLIVDEAHSLGLFGDNGSGLSKALGLENQVDIIMGTLGKACGVCGAFAAACGLITTYLVNNCRPFIFTTALPPFVTGALHRALEIIHREKRGPAVLAKAALFRQQVNAAGLATGDSASQIIPLILGSNAQAAEFMQYLSANGIFAPAIRPPTVPVNTARVRLSVCYHHTAEDLACLLALIQKWNNRS